MNTKTKIKALCLTFIIVLIWTTLFLLQKEATKDDLSNKDANNVTDYTTIKNVISSDMELLGTEKCKISSAELAVQQFSSPKERGLPDNDIFSKLESPTPYSYVELELMTSELLANEIFCREDEITKNYPLYSKVYEDLKKELAKEISFETFTTEELVKYALYMRSKFWEHGGNMSPNSYKYAYKARILLELAYADDLRNLAIGDELVETIQLTNTRWVFADKTTNKKLTNREFQKELLTIRLSQFNQIASETKEGQKVGWQDFVRVCDLATLLCVENRERERDEQVISWLMKQARYHREWGLYLEPLHMLEESLNDSKWFQFRVFHFTKGKYPNEYRYSRRLPSFKGPIPETRGIVPLHVAMPLRSTDWTTPKEALVEEKSAERSP